MNFQKINIFRQKDWDPKDFFRSQSFYEWYQLFLSGIIILNKTINFWLRSASRHKLICKEFCYKHLSFLASRCKSTHADNVCIIAETCSLCRINIRNECCICTFYFVCSNGNTDSCSADKNTAIVFFSCYSLCNFNCNICVDWIFASEICYFTVTFSSINLISASFSFCAFGSHPIAIFISISSYEFPVNIIYNL